MNIEDDFVDTIAKGAKLAGVRFDSDDRDLLTRAVVHEGSMRTDQVSPEQFLHVTTQGLGLYQHVLSEHFDGDHRRLQEWQKAMSTALVAGLRKELKGLIDSGMTSRADAIVGTRDRIQHLMDTTKRPLLLMVVQDVALKRWREVACAGWGCCIALVFLLVSLSASIASVWCLV